MTKRCIQKIWIEPGCITCGACEFVAPEIFEVSDVSRIKQSAPVADHQTAIKEAIELCPVNVIQYEEADIV